MRHSYLAVLSGIILIVILGMSWCGRKPVPESATSPTPIPTATITPALPPAQSIAPSATPTITPIPSPAKMEPSATPAPLQPPSAELRKATAKIEPAVILITTFDATGKLLRTGTGFFAAGDGRLITNWHLVQDAAYAVAKSPDGKIRNVSGVVASAPNLDLAVLKAETKIGVPFIQIGKNTEAKTTVAVVGSSLGQHEQPLGAVEITGRDAAAGNESLVTSTAVSSNTDGSPLVDENGEAVGIVALTSESNQTARPIVRTADALSSLLGQTKADSPARFAGAPNEFPTPTPVSKGKVIFSPSPVYPERARYARPPLSGTGRFRIMFDATGQARSVQIMRSTGQPILDQAAVEAFQKWKSTPGHEWSLVIPITFQPR